MVYKITKEKDLEEDFKKLKITNIKEYTILQKKIEEMQKQAEIVRSHKNRYNTFDKPLQNYKWIEINGKILVFTINPIKKEIHLCEYMPRNEVFN